MGEEYTCAMCKGVFERTTPEDKALAELEEFFGDISVDDCDIVCDDCWQKIRPDKHGLELPVKEKDIEDGMWLEPSLSAPELLEKMANVIQKIINELNLDNSIKQ